VKGFLTIQEHAKGHLGLEISTGQLMKTNKGCVALWPYHLHLKVSYGKRRTKETQIFHHAKI